MAGSHWNAPWGEQTDESIQSAWEREYNGWRSWAQPEYDDKDDASRHAAVAAPPPTDTAFLQQWPSTTGSAGLADPPGPLLIEHAGNVFALDPPWNTGPNYANPPVLPQQNQAAQGSAWDPPSSSGPPSLCSSSTYSHLVSGPVLLDKINQLSAGLKTATATLVDEETVSAAKRLHAELARWMPTVTAATTITAACQCSTTSHEHRCRADVQVTFDPTQMTVIGRLTSLREFECWSYCRCSAYMDTTGAQCDSFVIVRHGGCCMPLTGWRKAGGRAKGKFICDKSQH